MIILSIILINALSQQIKPSDFAVSLLQVQSLIHYDLKVNQDAVLFRYPKGTIYKSNILTNSTNILCNVQHDTITLTNNMTKQIIMTSKDKSEQDQKIDSIINSFHSDNKLGLVTELNNFILFNLDTLEIIHKHEISSLVQINQQFQEGVFSKELNMAFLFYQNTLIIQNDKGNITNQTIQEMAITKLLCSLGYLFIATKGGLQIYWIDVENQIIVFRYTIEQNQNIIDIQLSTKNEYIFLLQADGIHIYKLLFDNWKQIQIKPYSILPEIPISNSIAFNQNNDQSFVVLIKPQKSVIFVDLEVNLVQGVWFLVSTHNLKISAQNIEINNNYVVIKGSETHNLIRHSSPNIYTNIFNYYPFTLAHATQLFFYSSNKLDTIDILFAIDTDSITFFQLNQIDGILICSTNEKNLIGQNFFYQVQTNLSDCQKKQQYNEEIQSKDLIVCQFNTDLEINVVSDNSNELNRQMLITISIFLGIALLLSIIILIGYGRKTRKQLIQYEQQLKKYQQFQGDHNEASGTRQATPQIDNNFKIDEFEQ